MKTTDPILDSVITKRLEALERRVANRKLEGTGYFIDSQRTPAGHVRVLNENGDFQFWTKDILSAVRCAKEAHEADVAGYMELPSYKLGKSASYRQLFLKHLRRNRRKRS